MDGGKEREIIYGSAWTKGFDARDTICLQLDPTSCIEDADVFIVTDQKGFQKTYHGIQGLAMNLEDNQENLVLAMRK